jgi:hypothetical protein
VTGVWLTDLPDVLRAAGLTVVEVPGWRTDSPAGQGFREFKGVMWHHDASPEGPSPGVPSWMKSSGAANLWIGRDARVHVVRVGTSWHAGTGGGGWGIPKDAGNYYLLGIETDKTFGEPFAPAQLHALRLTTAAIFAAYRVDLMIRHLDWTNGEIDGLPRFPTYGRKNDPDGLDLRAERAIVAAMVKNLTTDPKTAKKMRELQRRLDRTRAEAQRRREAGESTAGLPSRIARLKYRIRRLAGK